LNNFGELISGIFLGIILGTSFGVVESCSGDQLYNQHSGIIVDLAMREIGFDNVTLGIRFGN